MLLRPPSISDQNDNLSHFNTESDARQSSKSKNKVKRKQTSLSIKNKNPYNGKESQQKQIQKEQDNGSVHSHASGRSKRSKKKQSSIGLNKPRGAYMTLNSPRKSEEDEEIKVIDYATIIQNSQKKNKNYVVQYSQVKNDYLGSNNNKPQTKQFNNLFPNPQTNQKYSFRNVFQNGPQLIKKQNSKQSIDDEVPVVKLVEAKSNNMPNQNYNNFNNNVVNPKMIQRRQTKKLGQLFEQNRRNIQNQSSLGVSGVPSQVANSALGGESRRSRSKLGQLFKQRSKQKQMNNSSKVQFSQNASSNYQSLSDLNLNLQSNIEGPRRNDGVYGLGNIKNKDKQNLGRNNNIPEKVLEQSVHQFQGAQQNNKSDLNLSLSRNSPFTTKFEYNRYNNEINNKDSVCFNIQPEKQKRKKGLGLASKLNASQQDLIKISGNLVSKQLNQPNSKQSDAHQRLKQNLNQNQKYLMESGAATYNDFTQQQRQKQQKQRQQKMRIQRQRQQQRRKQQQNKKYQQNIRKQQEKRKLQRIRKQEEAKKQQLRKKEEERKKQQQKIKQQQRRLQQQYRRQQKRLKLQQERQQKILQMEKQQQIEQQKLKQRQIRKKKQLQNKRLKQKQQQEEALRQRQRLKNLYHKQQQQIRKSHEQTQKQRSFVYQLENDSNNEPQPRKNYKKQSSLSRLPSSFSKQQSSCRSQKSQQSRKSTKKKQSVIAKNKTKHYVGEISPRAQQSFYQQPKSDKDIKNKEQKAQKAIVQPRKLMSFSQQQDLSYEPKPQYKTDTYFYDKSIRAPSSKPPLSRKSSTSKSKPKQGMISKKNPKDSQVKVRNPEGANCQKKLSLVQLAMRKNYQPASGSQNQSQDSFRSRQKSIESLGSRNSRNSSGSRGSQKKQSVIRIKQNTLNSFNRPPLQRKNSSQNQENLRNKTWRHSQMDQQSQYSTVNKVTEVQSKVRIIKGCSFIDQRGRLVQNGNMMIKGNQVAGTTRKNEFDQKRMIQRLLNSRQKRRSRSRQRSLNRSRNSSRSNEKTNSKYFNSSNQTQKPFAESQAYQESQGRYESSGSNFYGRNDNSYYQNSGASRTNFGNSQYKNRTPQNLQQFIKPIQQAGVTRIKNQAQNIYYDRQRQGNRKRTMQRTEKRI